MYEVVAKESSNKKSQIIGTSNDVEIKSKDINDHYKVTEFNIDLIYNEIKEFIHYYLFSGEVSTDFTIKVQDLFEMDDDDLRTLKTVHFLLSDEVRDLIQILPYLLRNLSHSTQKKKEEFNGIVRGRIDWNATLKTRYSKGFNDPSLFVCSPPSKFYDLEENQLLKFVLKKILSLKNNYLDFVDYTKNDEDTPFDIDNLSNENNWYEIVGNNYKMAKKTLRKVYFDDISDVKVIKVKHIRKAFKNRNVLYHRVAKAFMLYEDLFINENIELLKELVEHRLIRATNPNKLYEIYIFYSIVKMLPSPELRLLHGGNDYSTCDVLEDGTKVTVHYQYLPKPLQKVSQYAEILRNYSIQWAYRAPDIILEFEKDGKITYRIIEVKNSSSTNYVRDSVYKVMGYYKDFERILYNSDATFCDNCPVVLVTWGGIRIKKDYDPFGDSIIVLNRKEFLDNLYKLIELE